MHAVHALCVLGRQRSGRGQRIDAVGGQNALVGLKAAVQPSWLVGCHELSCHIISNRDRQWRGGDNNQIGQWKGQDVGRTRHQSYQSQR